MRQDLSATLVSAIANPLGFVGRPTLSVYLDTGTLTWTWDSESPTTPVYFNVGQLYAGNGLDPASLEVEVYSDSPVIDGSTVLQAVMGAAEPFLGRRMTLGLAIVTTAGTEVLTVFDGTITQPKASTIGITLLATGAMTSADAREGTMPVELMCPWILYSTDCGATVVEGDLTATSGSTSTQIHVSALGWSGYSATPADLVRVPSGETAFVRAAAAGVITLDRPVTPPTVGQAVHMTMGCRKTFADCKLRHANERNYGGCPCRPVEAISI